MDDDNPYRSPEAVDDRAPRDLTAVFRGTTLAGLLGIWITALVSLGRAATFCADEDIGAGMAMGIQLFTFIWLSVVVISTWFSAIRDSRHATGGSAAMNRFTPDWPTFRIVFVVWSLLILAPYGVMLLVPKFGPFVLALNAGLIAVMSLALRSTYAFWRRCFGPR